MVIPIFLEGDCRLRLTGGHVGSQGTGAPALSFPRVEDILRPTRTLISSISFREGSCGEMLFYSKHGQVSEGV